MRVASFVTAPVVLATLVACGSSHHASAYSGRLYSVAQVQRAFAQLGLELHKEAEQSPGLVVLELRARLPVPRAGLGIVTVGTRRAKAVAATSLPGRVTRYANVTAVSKSGVLEEVRGAMSALRWGTDSPAQPGKRVIVLADSIGGIRLGEPRRRVEQAFGPGRPGGRGVVRYFHGRLLVGYEFHDGIYKWVTYLETRWRGYRVPRSGVHVGSSRDDLRRLYVSCYHRTACILQAGPWPDPLGSAFTLRRGRVAEIYVGRLA